MLSGNSTTVTKIVTVNGNNKNSKSIQTRNGITTFVNTKQVNTKQVNNKKNIRK